MQGTVLVIIYQERKTPNRTENEKRRGGHYINPKTETESFLKFFLIHTRL